MALPHGFKAKADRIAVGLRRQMGIRVQDPINVDALAAKLGLAIFPLSSFADACPDQVAHLVNDHPSDFSALLLRLGNRCVILENDQHTLGRRSSNLAHEMAHYLLGHSPMALNGGFGHGSTDPDIEKQADCLASYILIPNAAAHMIVWKPHTEDQVCRRFGVSRQMLEYRLNTSGARLRRKRWLTTQRQ